MRGRPLSFPAGFVQPSTPPPPVARLHQQPPRCVATELCIMDGELLRKISPTELEGGKWMKADKVS